jgi:hypothetical protein
MQEVQVATRLSQIMISIAIILLCSLFVTVDCPIHVAHVVDLSKIHVIIKEEELKVPPP